jgi:hypothetical protein
LNVLRKRRNAFAHSAESASVAYPAHGDQLLIRSHPMVVELADFVAERAFSSLEPELAARASAIRTKA